MKRLLQFNLSLAFILLLSRFAAPVFAEIQIDVSNNGAGSSNSVDQSVSQTTNASQSNAAEVTNDVHEEASSGENSISDSNGQTLEITTGNVDSSTSVTTQVNNSQVTAGCCQGEQTITISGNGSGSTNTVNSQVSQNTTVSVIQSAQVKNNLSTKAITGANTVKDSAGNVLITTGDVINEQSVDTILNDAIITGKVSMTDVLILLKGNAVDSDNVVNLELTDNLTIFRENEAQVINNFYSELISGNNSVLGNLNNVIIKTGDVISKIDIATGPINSGGVDVFCCEDGQPIPPENPPGEHPSVPPPSTTTSVSSSSGNGGSSAAGNGGGGSTLANLTDILPVTGASALHFWMWAVVYLLMFLSGLYVRLRAGRSPNLRFAQTRYA